MYNKYFFSKFIDAIFIKLFKNDIFYKKILRMTYNKVPNNLILRNFINVQKLNTSNIRRDTAEIIAENYFNHRFDLLGSGLKYVGYDKSLSRLEILKSNLGNLNRKRANKILKNISNDYNLIKWNRDFQNDYIWPNKILNYNAWKSPRRADIKYVWELCRMQHLCQLAIFSIISEKIRKIAIKEFKDEIYDFAALNPVGIGPCWNSPMDASIRAINWLVSFDILSQITAGGEEFSKDFESFFKKQIWLHGKYIINNLEYDIRHKCNGNHYLSNLTGLLFISGYLYKDNKCKNWYKFAKQEFRQEISKQFNEEGSNFEGSTFYHYLSSSMMIYGAAMIKRVDGKLHESIEKAIVKAIHFSACLVMPDKEDIQIGDNDSGKILKLTPIGTTIKSPQEQVFCENEMVKQVPLIALAKGLVNFDEYSEICDEFLLETSFIKVLSNSGPKEIILREQIKKEIKQAVIPELNSYVQKTVTLITFPDYEDLSEGEWQEYDQFGIYVYKTQKVSLFVRTMGEKLKKVSHMHNDMLHCEICYKGFKLIADPGAYVYSSDRLLRNQYRSAGAHFVPYYKEEPNRLTDTFGLEIQSKCRCIGENNEGLWFYLEFKAIKHYRKIKILKNSIEIEDYGNQVFTLPDLTKPRIFSNGYGKEITLKMPPMIKVVMRTERRDKNG